MQHSPHDSSEYITSEQITDPINPYVESLPNEHPNDIPNTDTEFCGIISTEAQFKWAEKQPKPPRTILSESARRLVLRPDHLCRWAASWIGKRNQKFYILFNLYATLYLAIFVLNDIRAAVALSSSSGKSTLLIFEFIFGMLGAICFLITLSFFLSALYDTFHNQTQWEQWNNIDPKKFDRGLKLNCEDVFGSCNQWWSFLCPTSPWKGKKNSDLFSGYLSYFTLEQERVGNVPQN